MTLSDEDTVFIVRRETTSCLTSTWTQRGLRGNVRLLHSHEFVKLPEKSGSDFQELQRSVSSAGKASDRTRTKQLSHSRSFLVSSVINMADCWWTRHHFFLEVLVPREIRLKTERTIQRIPYTWKETWNNRTRSRGGEAVENFKIEIFMWRWVKDLKCRPPAR